MQPAEITLQTERLLLRGMTPAHIKALFESHSSQDFMRLFGIGEKDYEKYRNMVLLGMETDRLSLIFFLLLEPETKRALGQCGFHTWNRFHDRAEIFYFLNQDADKGKGFMKEALAAVLEYGFRKMRLHRIEAFVAPANTPSVRSCLS